MNPSWHDDQMDVGVPAAGDRTASAAAAPEGGGLRHDDGLLDYEEGAPSCSICCIQRGLGHRIAHVCR